jgi:cyclase
MFAKPRLIFVLLWDRGNYVLSRNFRLQVVGNRDWLQRNYNFNNVSRYIDELVVLNVSRGERSMDDFAEELRCLSTGVFTPVSAGGWITSPEDVALLLRCGADRVIINTLLFHQQGDTIQQMARLYGSQCLVASLDVRKENDQYIVYSQQGQQAEGRLDETLVELATNHLGELFVTSIDQDGTGMGFDLELAKMISDHTPLPFILGGGAGNARHFGSFFALHPKGAAATAHLFNFIGSGLKSARTQLLEQGVNLARWELGSSYND